MSRGLEKFQLKRIMVNMIGQEFKRISDALPESPGVYFFVGSDKTILYIGKATSLRDRVASYFSKDLIFSRSPLITQMVAEAVTIDFQTTDSVLEALILEANLIKKHQPRYNTKEKDNKSFNYVVITDEDFPRVLLVRGRDLELKAGDYKLQARFGPFPHGAALKEGMKIIRKIFPWRDNKCKPFDELKDKSKARPCFSRQIGLCPGVCTGEISKKEYRDIVRNIILFFEGKKKMLVTKLEKEMVTHARVQEFEKATRVKRTLFGLTHIQDIALLKREFGKTASGDVGKFTSRIEAYDVAHMAGKSVVGVMVVLEDSEVKKSDYRKFKIKENPGVDDTGALREVLVRRLNHAEWPLPTLIVVDGAVAQVNVAEGVLKERGLTIPVIGVVKNEQHKPERFLGDSVLIEKHKDQILLANSEAHRFAIGYHRQIRRNF